MEGKLTESETNLEKVTKEYGQQLTFSTIFLLIMVGLQYFYKLYIVDEKVKSLGNELKNANDLLEAARQRGGWLGMFLVTCYLPALIEGERD